MMTINHLPKIIAVVGPTASGKSELALDLAQAWLAQVYCTLNLTLGGADDAGTPAAGGPAVTVRAGQEVPRVRPAQPQALAVGDRRSRSSPKEPAGIRSGERLLVLPRAPAAGGVLRAVLPGQLRPCRGHEGLGFQSVPPLRPGT